MSGKMTQRMYQLVAGEFGNLDETLPIPDRRYILVDRYGDVVVSVCSTGFETVKLKWCFGRDVRSAMKFSMDDLKPILFDFVRGYGGRLVRIK